MNTGQRVVFRLLYVCERQCDWERRTRSIVRRAFDDVNVVTVYHVRRAFTVMKDVVSTNLLSNVVYSFECLQCDSRQVGRTLQRLSARVKQHVPLYLLSSEATGSRPRRGSPPGLLCQGHVRPPALTLDTECDTMLKCGVSRSVRPQNEKRSDGTVNARDNVDTSKQFLHKEYQSAIARHLSLNMGCGKACCDDFLVLYRVLDLVVTLKSGIGIRSCTTS